MSQGQFLDRSRILVVARFSTLFVGQAFGAISFIGFFLAAVLAESISLTVWQPRVRSAVYQSIFVGFSNGAFLCCSWQSCPSWLSLSVADLQTIVNLYAIGNL
jgi:hypothetical protein